MIERRKILVHRRTVEVYEVWYQTTVTRLPLVIMAWNVVRTSDHDRTVV